MKRAIAIDAAGFFLALAGILNLLWIPTPAYPSDDHTMREVEVLLGSPPVHRVATCGGGTDEYGDTAKKFPCVIWEYPIPETDGEILIAFYRGNKRLADVRLWDTTKKELLPRKVSNEVLKTLHESMHEARDAAPVKKSAAKKVET
jgi:hypothetical protein